MSQSDSINPKNDALLRISRIIITISQWAFIFAGSALIVMIPCIFIFSGPIMAWLGEMLVEPPDATVLYMAAALLVMCLPMAALSYFAFNRLRRIVDSVGEGDPFIPINGVRLRGMGVAVLAIQILGFAASLVGAALLAVLGEWKPAANVHLENDFGVSLFGILLGLLLILLARIFDRGAAMREELQGTV